MLFDWIFLLYPLHMVNTDNSSLAFERTYSASNSSALAVNVPKQNQVFDWTEASNAVARERLFPFSLSNLGFSLSNFGETESNLPFDSIPLIPEHFSDRSNPPAIVASALPQQSIVNQFDRFVAHNDGNNNDVDDISSLPIQAAYINAAGLQDRTTFFYNNNLGEPNNTRGDRPPRGFDQMVEMRTSAEFVEKLGIQTYDYQAGIERTTQQLVEILNSGERVLIFEGGPLEATYRALERVSPQNRSNITLLLHGGRTFNRTQNLATRPGVFAARNWFDIQRDFPEVSHIGIPNQNGPHNSERLGFNSILWRWLDNTNDPIFQEAREVMRNSRSEKSANDPSDSGMIFYALTGNENGDPQDAREFFNQFPPTVENAPNLIIQGPVSVVERQAKVLDIQTSLSINSTPQNDLTYQITGGDDRNRFRINNNGVLRFKNPPTFNNPQDTNGDNYYDVEVTVTDSSGRSDRELIEIEVRPAGSPRFLSDSSINVDNIQQVVLDINAVDDIDEERSGLRYRISGGPDKNLFEIDANSAGSIGSLTFKSPPGSGNPVDANQDGTYQVEVTVTDSDDNSTKQQFRIVVGNS